MGGIGAVAEPLVVIALLIGGTWINRDSNPGRRRRPRDVRRISEDGATERYDRGETAALMEEDVESRSSSPSLLATQEPKWRKRTLAAWGFSKEVVTPNTRRFKGYFLSRLLERFPFLVECWYWALIYWVSYGMQLLTCANKSGISTRSSVHSCVDCRRYRICSTKTRPRSYRRRRTMAHILGTSHSAFLHEQQAPDDMDQPDICVYTHPRLDCISHLAVLLHKYTESHS